jgi:N utilization substance protein B
VSAGGDGPPGRRAARERALGLLYEAEAKELPLDEVVAAQPVRPDEYAVDLVEGVAAHRVEIDELLERFARDWPLARMPAVDRALLRLATFELGWRPDVPTGAVLSEAVELAAQYSTDASSKFVNGVLAAIADDRRPNPEIA